MALCSFLLHPSSRWNRHRWWQGGKTDPGGWWQSGNLGFYGCGWQNGVFARADADGVCGGSVGCGGGGLGGGRGSAGGAGANGDDYKNGAEDKEDDESEPKGVLAAPAASVLMKEL